MTILVDETTCTRCGICSIVCPMRIIGPTDEITLPRVKDEKAGMCIACGHCEVSCPSQSLILNVRPDERVSLRTAAGMLAPEDLGIYLKKRRTVRHYTKEPVPREKIEEVLDIARYAASGGNAQPVQWRVVYDPAEVHRLAGLTVDWMRSICEYQPSDERICPFHDCCMGTRLRPDLPWCTAPRDRPHS